MIVREKCCEAYVTYVNHVGKQKLLYRQIDVDDNANACR